MRQFASCLMVALAAPWLFVVAAADVDFESEIKPLLAEKCFDCHGPDTQEHHLRLDRRAAMLRGGDSGEPAIVPGNSELSHLIQLVQFVRGKLANRTRNRRKCWKTKWSACAAVLQIWSH